MTTPKLTPSELVKALEKRIEEIEKRQMNLDNEGFAWAELEVGKSELVAFLLLAHQVVAWNESLANEIETVFDIADHELSAVWFKHYGQKKVSDVVLNLISKKGTK